MGLRFSPNNTGGGNLRFTTNQPGLLSSVYSVDWDNITNVPTAVGNLADPGDLTGVNDTNVTLTLGGTPVGALLADVSLTLGWTSTLAVTRGGTGGGTASGTLLDNITAFSSTGQIVRTGAGAYSFRTLTGPAAGISVTNGDGVAGNPTLALANDLLALEGLGSTGIAVRSAADTWLQRSVAGTANEITATNGDGVSGNPTLSLPTALTFTGKTVTGGTFSLPTISVADASLSIVDDGDNTKVLKFQASGITAGQTRTLTAQDASGTVYITGGTDVAIADGGTGQSTAPLGINALITGSTQDTSPDPAADYVGTADASASTGKKVLMGDFPIRQYWGCQATVVGGSTVYVGVVSRANEADSWCTMPFAGTLTKLYVNVDAAPGVGNQVAFTMRKNGVDQTVTCTISGGAATTANDTAHSFTFAAGDTIVCKEVPSAAVSSTRAVVNWEMTFKRND